MSAYDLQLAYIKRQGFAQDNVFALAIKYVKNVDMHIKFTFPVSLLISATVLVTATTVAEPTNAAARVVRRGRWSPAESIFYRLRCCYGRSYHRCVMLLLMLL